jgi:hypothetical protein
MMINISSLFFCTENYAALFNERTDHMTLFMAFIMNLMPEILTPELLNRVPTLLKDLAAVQASTPSQFFNTFEENQSALPRFAREMSQDLQDIIDFYRLSFREIRAGRTKSTRIFRIPEY